MNLRDPETGEAVELVGKHEKPREAEPPETFFEAHVNGRILLQSCSYQSLQDLVDVCNRAHLQATFYQVTRVLVDTTGVPL